ncbi:DNA-binding response regulator [Thalassobacillus sp. CUG 92003]|uniref:response regulator transcription factor n=1 Tax=Thalassobacillus sp. CUG 92003 TaxID=2736641 RepID=UPI0015E67C23|nr:response regulator transcription factor [Thalassobacillus sp. CUG 92003]
MIRIVLAEDQTMLRGALSTLLNMEEDLSIIKEVSNGKEAWQALQDITADVALLDIEMPEMSGLRVLQHIREANLPLKVIILTTFSLKHYVTEAIRHQVDGYVLKDTPSDELADHIRRVMQGKQVISPEVMEQVLFEDQNPLSSQESAILRFVETGKTSQQIAKALYLGEGTVRNYLSSINQKLGTQNRTEAVYQAKVNGWL